MVESMDKHGRWVLIVRDGVSFEITFLFPINKVSNNSML